MHKKPFDRGLTYRIAGSVESCGGGLVKPELSYHLKWPTTTGCNSTKNRKSYICFNLCYGNMSKSSDQITTGKESKKAQADQKAADKKVTISKETASKSV